MGVSIMFATWTEKVGKVQAMRRVARCSNVFLYSQKRMKKQAKKGRGATTIWKCRRLFAFLFASSS